jgi:Uncharacterized protein conserved in bacteria (DUF2252)
MELTRDERVTAGKKARKEVPRSSHGEWEPSAGRPDPVELLQEQATTRVPELVPIRYGRMSVSPFTFYRGAALLPAGEARDLQTAMQGLFDEYKATLQDDRRRLLEGYRFVDLERKIVGVGSVGTRCWILLLEGRSTDRDPLFLQFKEAGPSVLERFAGESEFENHGRRAIADFAELYADQSERDYDALLAAIESGRVVAESGV